MAHTILTPLMITRESLRILHGKLSFIGACNKQYDNRFAEDGAKIGDLLNIRMPPRYKVRTGATLAAQDHVERSTPFRVSSQIGVDVSFTTFDLTMNLNDFGKKFLEPQITQLAAYLESEAATTGYKLIPMYAGVTTTNTGITYRTFQQCGQYLTEQLAPYAARTHLLDPSSRVDFSDAVKGLFQDSSNIAEQYKEGKVGRTGGFEVMENTFLPPHTNGTLAGTTLLTGANLGLTTTSNAWASSTDVVIDGATSGTTIRAGDILTFSGVYDVHPETKANLGRLKPFVAQNDVTLTTTANPYTVTVKPALIRGVGNAYQNVVLSGVSDTDNLTVTRVGAASAALGQNLAFHEDAFCFGTADLIDVAKYGAWGARTTMDNISMRVAKQYDIVNDRIPCRIDVVWGFGGLYASEGLAVRHLHLI